MKSTTIIRGVPTIRRALANRIKRHGVHATARDCSLPVSTVGKRAHQPERLSVDELSSLAALFGAELALVVKRPKRWQPIHTAGVL